MFAQRNIATRIVGFSGLGLGCVLAVGCQATRPNQAAENAAASAMFAGTPYQFQPEGQAGPPPQGMMPNARMPQAPMRPMAPPSSHVAQAGYNQVSEQGVPPELRRMPMGQYPGAYPVASGPGQAHGPSCPCCASSFGKYKPVYDENFSCGDASAGSGQAAPYGMEYRPPNFVDPQEYIYDGGDQTPEVRVRKDHTLTGLGPEDTVIQYTTEDGREFAQTGCRAAIYAPRFASVRRVTSFGSSDGVLAARAAFGDLPPVQVNAPMPTTVVRDRNRLGRESNVKVVEAFRDRNRGVPILQNDGPLAWKGNFKPFEDLQLIKFGQWNDTERVAVQKATAAAAAWTNMDELIVIVRNQQTDVVESTDHAQELRTYELGDARIRLCKVASQQSANVGDVIDFTIRFDNLAEQTLTELVIHDSLPPRMEYVADSEQSSLESSFEAVPNEVGSQTLRWTIKESIKPGQGGIVRFQCRVR